jgi:hypothetical protein
MEDIFDGVYVARFIFHSKKGAYTDDRGARTACVHASRTSFDSMNYENAISSASFGQRSLRYYYPAREPRSRSSSRRGKKYARRRSRKRYVRGLSGLSSLFSFFGVVFFRCYFLVLTRLITKTFFRQNQQLRKELDDAQKAQTMLVERLISCCKEVRESFHNTIPLPPFPARFAKEKKNFFGHRV